MTEARPYASLSSGLLARKGAAKPAMRPQGYAGFEDLGWNDMGPEAAEHVPSSIAALTPAPKATREEPPIAAQQALLRENFGGEEPPAPAPEPAACEAAQAEIVALRRRHPAVEGRKAAFTLRLDADRHLRLRLACAVTGRSAQQLVTGALDGLLDGLPELEALAATTHAAAGAKRN